jgi:hypothetical protein
MIKQRPALSSPQRRAIRRRVRAIVGRPTIVVPGPGVHPGRHEHSNDLDVLRVANSPPTCDFPATAARL